MAGAYKSVNQLIEQGYLITDADDKWSGEVWALQPATRTNSASGRIFLTRVS